MTRDLGSHSLALGYLQAKLAVLRSPFGEEVLVHDQTSPHNISETDLLRECAWAILSCGMAEYVVRGLFERVSGAFFEWSSAHAIANDRIRCVRRARKVFDNTRKLRAIVAVADSVAQRGFEECVRSLQSDPIEFLSSFSYLGPASARHAAKNLGFVFAKPDRHLLNLADLLGYSTPDVLCNEIADLTGESVRVVDLVLWRFCAMQRGGAQRFIRLLECERRA
jgi:hypothetical protein